MNPFHLFVKIFHDIYEHCKHECKRGIGTELLSRDFYNACMFTLICLLPNNICSEHVKSLTVPSFYKMLQPGMYLYIPFAVSLIFCNVSDLNDLQSNICISNSMHIFWKLYISLQMTISVLTIWGLLLYDACYTLPLLFSLNHLAHLNLDSFSLIDV